MFGGANIDPVLPGLYGGAPGGAPGGDEIERVNATITEGPDLLGDLSPMPEPVFGSELTAETPTPTAAPAPTTGGGDLMSDLLRQFGAEGLEQPSRYDIPFVQNTIDLINQELTEQRGRSMADLDEYFSGRGLVGSSVEADVRGQTERGLERQRMSQLLDLQRSIAETSARDRESAAGIAERAGRYGLAEEGQEFGQQMQAGQFAEQVAGRLQQESQFARGLTSSDAQFAMSAGLQLRAQELQAEGMSLDEAYRNAALEQEETLRTRALDLQQQGIEEESAYRYAALEQDWVFRRRALDLQEQGMGLDEAYRYAELEMRERVMEEDRRMQMLSLILQAIEGVGIDAFDDLLYPSRRQPSQTYDDPYDEYVERYGDPRWRDDEY
jgi:hypothetical protein